MCSKASFVINLSYAFMYKHVLVDVMNDRQAFHTS